MSTSRPKKGPRRTLECTAHCQLFRHAFLAISAVTHGTDAQIAVYLKGLCANYCHLVDIWGRTVLHVAASCNRWKLVHWLLRHKRVDRDARDRESGWTPLHRSLFYGQLSAAKVLVEHGASMSLRDDDCLTPLDIVMKDRPRYVEYGDCGLYEVYVWGYNNNFNLGLAVSESRQSPNSLDVFCKPNVNIKQVAMQSFHTVFLSTAGQVFVCGSGSGGRMGSASESIIVVPKRLPTLKSEVCVRVAVGIDHTVLLMESGSVWTCGMNTYHQLGHKPPPPCLMAPKRIDAEVLNGHELVTVCAGNFHTVIVAKDAVFTFGLNAGQLGHQESGDKLITVPSIVSVLPDFAKDPAMCFTHAATSDAAFACVTKSGGVFVLFNYRCRRIAYGQREVLQIEVFGGHLDPKRCDQNIRKEVCSELRVAILTKCGQLFLWSEPFFRLVRCLVLLNRPIHVSSMGLFQDGIIFTTADGEGYVGTIGMPKTMPSPRDPAHGFTSKSGGTAALVCLLVLLHRLPLKMSPSVFAPGRQVPRASKRATTSSSANWLDLDECFSVKVQRLAKIHRGVGVACDRFGNNFAVVQGRPRIGMLDLPILSPSCMALHFAAWLSEADVSDDVHDVVIQVGSRQFAAHRFILASRSEKFRKIILNPLDNGATVDENGMLCVDCSEFHPAVFEHLLTFVYTDDCDLLTPGYQFPSFINLCNGSGSTFDPLADSARRHVVVADAVEDNRKRCARDKKKNKKSPPPPPKDSSPKDDMNRPNPICLLSSVSYDRGVFITSTPKERASYPAFDRESFPELYDVCIVAKGGQRIKCHKHILMARSDYFRCMLSSGWLEARKLSSVELPISGTIVEFILDFLYTDDCLRLRCTSDVELVCQVLVVADCFILKRMKELCELVVANLLTLRNIVGLLEFAFLYNAEQLKTACYNFIGLNLAAIFESKGICSLSDEALVCLTNSYRQMVPRMSFRVITPYSNFCPSEHFLEDGDAAILDTIDDETDMSVDKAKFSAAKEVAVSNRAKRRAQNKRASDSSFSENSQADRRRTRSVSSSASEVVLDVKEAVTENRSKEILVEASERNQVSPVESLTYLPSPRSSLPSSPTTTTIGKWLGGMQDLARAFPDLNDVKNAHSKRHSKRSPSLTLSNKLSDVENGIQPSDRRSIFSPKPITLSMFMEKYGMTVEENVPGAAKQPDTKDVEKCASPSLPPPQAARDRQNPWNVQRTPSEGSGDPVVAKERTPSFREIQRQEQRKQYMLRQPPAKELRYIQLEERAINQLLAVYCRQYEDEEISVQRLQPEFMASPVWDCKKKSTSTPPTQL